MTNPAIALLLPTLLGSCVSGPPWAPAPVAPTFQELHYFDTSIAAERPERTVIRSQSELAHHWERVSPYAETPPVPVVDFAEHMVVLVAFGTGEPRDSIRVIDARVETDAAFGLSREWLVVHVSTTLHCNSGTNRSVSPAQFVVVPRVEDVVYDELLAVSSYCWHRRGGDALPR